MFPNIRIAGTPDYCDKVQSCLKKMTDGGACRAFAGARGRVPEVHRTRMSAVSTLTVCEEIRDDGARPIE
jgi:hypothetical protein